jgi:serine/threonine-protein kinase
VKQFARLAMSERPSPRSAADHNLWFAVLALQAKVIDRDQFAEACSAWVTRPETLLADILLERGWLTPAAKATVEERLRRSDVGTSHQSASLSTVDTGIDANATTDGQPADAPTIDRVPGRSRFTVLRQHAQGGLGRVSLARDERLRRLVAVKEIRPDRQADSGLMRRFVSEAEVTGQLEHPGVVPVYALEEDEAGRPYYIMRFVRGRTLDDAIDAYHRNPTPLAFRDLLKRFVDVCNTVAYAHSKGVVHRDLKGTNVLVGEYGETLVVDWGLAKRMGLPSVEAMGPKEDNPVEVAALPAFDNDGAALTEAGSVLGTPAHMAPEQAAGRNADVGPRADVYALGTILYQILSGRCPYAGRSTADVLAMVRRGPPPLPSSVHHGVPRALEAICLKATARALNDRYAAATELARDIEHWLADEPVSAWREPLRVRAGRWMRRHRTAMVGAGALLMTAVIALAVSTLLISQEQHETARARDLADQNATEAREAQRRADDNARVAQDQTNLTVKTFYQVVVEVQNALRDRPDMQKLREKLLNDSLAGLNQVAKTAESSNLLQRTLGGAYQRMGDVALEMGQTAEAQRQYERALSIFEQLAALDREDDVSQWNLAVMYEKVGTVNHRLRGDISKTESYYRQATRLREALATGPRREPKLTQLLVDNALASSYAAEANLAVLMGKPALAREYLGKAVKLREELAAADASSLSAKEALATLYMTLGQTSFHLRDAAARDQYQKALQLREALAKADPDSVAFQNGVVDAHQKMGDMLLHLKGAESLLAVREHYTIAHELQQKLYQKNPQNTGMRQALASSHYRLGTIAQRLGGGADSQKQFRDCLQLREALAAEDPKNVYKQVELLLAQARCGEHTKAAEAADRLRKEAAEDASMLYYVGCGYALCALAAGADQPAATSEPRSLRERYLREAVATLRQAVDQGYQDLVSLETDPDLEAIQGVPAYKELLSRLKEHQQP